MTDALASALMEGSYSDGVLMLMRLIDSLGVARHVRLETTGSLLSSKDLFSIQKALEGLLEPLTSCSCKVELLIEAVRQKNCVRRVQPTFRKRLEQDNEAPLIVLATSGPLTPQWEFYFSIAKCGQTFMRCQWDSLLLEVADHESSCCSSHVAGRRALNVFLDRSAPHTAQNWCHPADCLADLHSVYGQLQLLQLPVHLELRIVEASSDGKNAAPPSKSEVNMFLVLAVLEWRRYVLHCLNEIRITCCAVEEDRAQFDGPTQRRRLQGEWRSYSRSELRQCRADAADADQTAQHPVLLSV
ncbi:hypothetical protein L915_13383 [Phytophthora nicotianae]|uniref:Uncharacterized protein n=1 Tax=Phytophthora nicotianae TaxID=4792 RepID=W2GDF0_PHYNI|nr:hypothetical protein L915_13383 [Phytophthora nicotianae]